MSTNYISQITATNGTTYDIQEGVTTRVFRATCSTAAGTAAKVATLDDATGYSLAVGVRVAVTFTYGNSAATPTLNVNSGGAKNIVVPTAVATYTSGNGTTYNTWGPYETVTFTYNGTSWVSNGSSYSIYNAYALANSKTANTGTITQVKTTAGAHTAIDVSSGVATFNVPTKTSHLTNDSGFITTDSDEKVKSTAVTSGTTTIYFTGSTSTSQETASLSKHASANITVNADSNSNGTTILTLGNNIADGTAGAKSGIIRLHGTSTKYIDLVSGAPTTAKTITFPDATGTIALTSDIPSIRLNGSLTTSPSFYAPTSAGTSGYYLKSNGSGAPTWTSFPTIINTRGTATSGGTTLSVVNTGDMYTWNNKATCTNLVNGSATGSLRGVNTRGESTSYTIGQNAFAEGNSTTASGIGAHAEGHCSIASGAYSHAEGFGDQTNAQSFPTLVLLAQGEHSHAEGHSTRALGESSHSQNEYTVAATQAQTALGTFNIADTVPSTAVHPDGTSYGNYAVIIGNGTNDNARSNALTVDWLGGVELYVDVDSSADASTDAVSGTDMDLFNTIRALGWYNDVII